MGRGGGHGMIYVPRRTLGLFFGMPRGFRLPVWHQRNKQPRVYSPVVCNSVASVVPSVRTSLSTLLGCAPDFPIITPRSDLAVWGGLSRPRKGIEILSLW